LLTQVEVARDDPAFTAPTKPIGSRMPEAEARRHAAEHGWQVHQEEDNAWRRVVASPRPRRIVELACIRELAAAGQVVIACGGGGIPVVADGQGGLSGVEAVIDKDFSSALLAHALGATLLLIATTVERVSLNFGTPHARPLDRMSLAQARAYAAQGQFPPGSMGPKIEAMGEFVSDAGRPGVITDPPNIARALAGETGTWLVPDPD
jgi:carbamate kinase